MKSCSVNIDEVNSSGIDDFIRLSQIEYDTNNCVTHMDQMRWKHLNTAFGPSTAINLQCDGEVVGRVLLQPRILYLDGEEIPIAFATDSLVHPDFRRPLSNFFSIMKEIKKVKKFPLVLHTANENTEGIYHNILKLECPISLSGYGTPVDLRNIVKKFLGFSFPLFQLINILYQWCLNFLHYSFRALTQLSILSDAPDNQVFNDFLIENVISNDLGLVRDAHFLEWRYKKSPLCKAEICHIYRKGSYLGYVVLRNIELENLNFMAVMDFALIKDVSKLEILFIRTYIIKKAIETASDAVFMLLNPVAKETKRLIGFPFVSIPDKYLPHKTPFFIHINDENRLGAERYTALHINLGDLDYF